MLHDGTLFAGVFGLMLASAVFLIALFSYKNYQNKHNII